MASAAIDLLRNTKHWQETSARAAADARTRFSKDNVVAQYEAFYKRAVT
jgi:glycosyltransferase involved in cell wall biosynthesis